MANIGSESRNRSGRNLRQYAIVIFHFFPSGHVEYLHVVQDSLFDRSLLGFLSFEYSGAITDEKRAKGQNRCHDASHACLHVLPKIDPNRVIISKTGETNTGDDDHGNGQTKKGTQTDLLCHFQLRAPKNDNRNADNSKNVNKNLQCRLKLTHDVGDDI